MAAPEGYTKLGNVGYADKGVYSADATYNKYNTVYHEGSTYVALKDNLHGVTPADGVNWRYMAKGFTEASADAITVIDTSGIIDGTKNKKTILQTFLDKVGDFIINKAVTNDALMLKLADYVAKTDIVQVESTATNKVPSSAYLKQVKDSIDSNLDITNQIAEVENSNAYIQQSGNGTRSVYKHGNLIHLRLGIVVTTGTTSTVTIARIPYTSTDSTSVLVPTWATYQSPAFLTVSVDTGGNIIIRGTQSGVYVADLIYFASNL